MVKPKHGYTIKSNSTTTKRLADGSMKVYRKTVSVLENSKKKVIRTTYEVETRNAAGKVVSRKRSVVIKEEQGKYVAQAARKNATVAKPKPADPDKWCVIS